MICGENCCTIPNKSKLSRCSVEFGMAYELFDCEEIITKVPLYAIERIEAVSKLGFDKTDRLLVGTMDGYAYKDYWTIKR